ncbi:uncharacterized protein LOC128735715 [Sabethes cyaneus]|uniref:uncharacterized protein LOC128735715 n=1 Tax=Sabethes cyaneus TaxID=53552 RepID=UPI00237D838D|nr:uncharacterized protein LOC128735715 [Sabethes cyaneus]
MAHQLFAANGTRIQTYGTKRLTIDLGLRRSFVWVFVIADVKSPIIGADFLKHFGLLADLRRNKLIDNTTRLEVNNINATSEPLITTFNVNSPFAEILVEYQDITVLNMKHKPTNASTVHQIITTGPPVFCRPRRLPVDKLNEAKAEFQFLMEQDISQPSKSCWASPLHLVKKSNAVPDTRFTHIHMDLIGPLAPSEGNLYCLTIIDKFTRWPEVFPLPNMTALTVARAFINGWIARFGVPTNVTTDCGRQFESELFNTLTRLLGITHLRTTPYHPQANGQIERTHRQLKSSIMCHQNSRWTEVLPIVLLGIRSSLKEELEASPAELTYGTSLRLPGEFFNCSESKNPTPEFVTDLKASMSKLRPTSTSNHSKDAVFVQKHLSSCCHVFIRRGAIKPPLSQPYDGPYRVIRRKEKVYIMDTINLAKVNNPLPAKPLLTKHALDAMSGSPKDTGKTKEEVVWRNAHQSKTIS